MANTLKMSEGVVTSYINGLEITSDATDIQIGVPRTVQSVKTFGENQIIPSTHHDVTSTFSAVNDYADDTLDETTWGLMTDTAQSAHTTGFGTTAGSRTYTVLGHMDSRALPVSIDNAIMLNGGLNGESVIRGKYLCRNLVLTGTGAETGIQFGADDVVTATQFMAGVMHLTDDDVTALTVVVEKSEDSTDGDDGTWNPIAGLSFTRVTVGHETDTATAGETLATDDWLRVNCTAFTGTDVTITVAVGRLED